MAAGDRSSSTAQKYLSMNEVAELLGVSVNTVKSYALKDLLPPPDAFIGQHRGWLRQTIKDWNYNRPRPSRRSPDPSMLKNRRDRRAKR
ncbi:helix-turn-helix transcriptional regulator [Mycobacterium hubeiense]|uniref:helix-turn-helix transcriptional regulator n=1 Tax=Mycobacterium hubeiense TaxID=1867256 RepID=UPI0018EDFFE4|nr:helix-turn-helix domain-containing protein [Mycobacterium sp. QGD 101]